MEQNNDHAKNTEKFIRMTTQPVEKLIAKLAVPTIISMLVTSFYNLADTFFVRQLENDSMVAAVGVVLPLMTLIQAFGFFCGHGSGNYISRAYGKQDYKDAETMAATGFCYAVLFGLIIGVLGLVFIASSRSKNRGYNTLDYRLHEVHPLRHSVYDGRYRYEQSAEDAGKRVLRHDRTDRRGDCKHCA